MFQKQIAERIGASEEVISYWERGRRTPTIRWMPAIIEFLGYDPAPEPQTLAEKLVRCRERLGLAKYQIAERLGVDVGTYSRWESGTKAPTRVHRKLVEAWLREVLGATKGNP
jgi:transcriptional regulator with XRE-family HTH domain